MKNILFISILFILSPKLLRAETPNFDFIEYGYTSANFDGLPQNLTGIDLSGSFTLFENYFIAVDYYRADAKDTEDKMEIRTYGLGYLYDYSDTTTIYAELAGTFLDPNGHQNHEKGYVLTTGARSNMGNNFELKAEIKIFDTKGYNMTVFAAGAAYNITNFFAVFADIEVESNSTRTIIGARYSF